MDDTVRRLVDDMFETMYQAPGWVWYATQVNVHRRVVVIDVEDQSQPLVFINPEITVLDEARCEYDEGCLSVRVFMKPSCRRHVRVKALDRDGKPFEITPSGLLAVCIQHEIDHLNSKLFVDHIFNLKRDRIRKIRKNTVRMNNLRIVFAGTPILPLRIWLRFCKAVHEVVAVYTQPDRPPVAEKLAASPSNNW